jgi:hypothetical protein
MKIYNSTLQFAWPHKGSYPQSSPDQRVNVNNCTTDAVNSKYFNSKIILFYTLTNKIVLDSVICNANSLKQHFTGRHVSPHGYIILILNQPIFALTP